MFVLYSCLCVCVYVALWENKKLKLNSLYVFKYLAFWTIVKMLFSLIFYFTLTYYSGLKKRKMCIRVHKVNNDHVKPSQTSFRSDLIWSDLWNQTFHAVQAQKSLKSQQQIFNSLSNCNSLIPPSARYSQPPTLIKGSSNSTHCTVDLAISDSLYIS